jgi:hypothetical protein
MSESTQPPTPDDETTTHQIPGWDRPKWAVRGVKDGPELIWQREAGIDVTYMDGGVEETFAPWLIRTDQVAIGEAGAAVHVGETVMPRTSRALPDGGALISKRASSTTAAPTPSVCC